MIATEQCDPPFLGEVYWWLWLINGTIDFLHFWILCLKLVFKQMHNTKSVYKAGRFVIKSAFLELDRLFLFSSLSYLSFARVYTVISISLFLLIPLLAQIWLSSPTFIETVTIKVTFILFTQCPIAKSDGVKKTCKIICGIWGNLNTDYLLSGK